MADFTIPQTGGTIHVSGTTVPTGHSYTITYTGGLSGTTSLSADGNITIAENTGSAITDAKMSITITTNSDADFDGQATSSKDYTVSQSGKSAGQIWILDDVSTGVVHPSGGTYSMRISSDTTWTADISAPSAPYPTLSPTAGTAGETIVTATLSPHVFNQWNVSDYYNGPFPLTARTTDGVFDTDEIYQSPFWTIFCNNSTYDTYPYIFSGYVYDVGTVTGACYGGGPYVEIETYKQPLQINNFTIKFTGGYPVPYVHITQYDSSGSESYIGTCTSTDGGITHTWNSGYIYAPTWDTSGATNIAFNIYPSDSPY